MKQRKVDKDDIRCLLNPITLGANLFIETIEKYGDQFHALDEELLITMNKLVDTINKFYDKSQLDITEARDIKFIKVKESDCLINGYQCKLCSKFMGNCALTAMSHINAVHLSGSLLNKEKFWVEIPYFEMKLPKMASSLLALKIDKHIINANYVADTLRKSTDYDVIEEDLKSSLQCLYPDKSITFYKFGSRISGIGNVECDLDIFVDIDGSFYNIYEATDQVRDVVKKLSYVLRSDDKWRLVFTYENARVPIIRVHHVSTKMQCDIGFSNRLAYCNTMLLQYYFDMQPIANRMCIFLRMWLERTRLSVHLFNYSLRLMVVYYLQMYSALPSVEDLQKDMNNKEYIGPWIGNFQRKTLDELDLVYIDLNKPNFFRHIHNFFTFYSNFDFQHHMICPYKGRTVKIIDIPEKFPQYVANFVDCGENEFNRPIVVQDPLELNQNVAKDISKSLFKVYIDYFTESATIITNNKQEKARSKSPATKK